jgi:hypothetical protein
LVKILLEERALLAGIKTKPACFVLYLLLALALHWIFDITADSTNKTNQGKYLPLIYVYGSFKCEWFLNKRFWGRHVLKFRSQSTASSKIIFFWCISVSTL